MKKTVLFSLMLAGASVALAACESTKEQFDFSKKAPDEFAVVKRAPLEMPPDFSVRAPQPGAPRPQELATDQMARQTILGEDVVRNTAKQNNVSEGEAVLLQKTGGANANASIRRTVDAETAKIIEEESPGIDKLKKLVGQKVEPPAKIIDPVAETNRLRENKTIAKPLSEDQASGN